MTITYPLSLPASPGFNEFTARPRNIVAVTRSPYTGSQQVQEHQGQWWGFDFNLPVLSDIEAAAWEVFITKLRGRRGTFLAGDPQRVTPIGSASVTPGTPVVDGAHSELDTTLSITGADFSATGYLLEGDYIQLGTGATATLHMVLSQVDTDGAGADEFDIWPYIRNDLSGGETVVVTSAKGVFRMDAPDTHVNKNAFNSHTLSFSASEDL